MRRRLACQAPGRRPAARGFTLIELVVAMVVIAILAAVAIPNYSAYVTRTKRSAAKTVLLDTANFLERAYTTNGCYSLPTANDCINNTGTPRSLALVAPTEGRASYRVVLSAVARDSFTLRAVPCGAGPNPACPAGSENFTDPGCGTLELTNTGARTVIGGTLPPTTCWQR
jgi:type IV pilus assembly protein PilE